MSAKVEVSDISRKLQVISGKTETAKYFKVMQ